MFLEALALVVTYTTMRVYEEKNKKATHNKSLKKKESTLLKTSSSNQVSATTETQEKRLVETESVEIPTTTAESRKEQPPAKSKLDKDMFGLSLASVALATTNYYYPLVPLRTALSATFIYTGLLPLRRTENLVRKKKIGHDTVIACLYIASLWTGHYVALAIGGSFYHLSRKIATKAKNYSEKKLINIFDQIPSKAWVYKDEIEIEVPVESLQLKDIVVVNTGTMIPIDGTIIGGEGIVDQRALTGESQPVERGIEEKVFAGTFLVAGKIFIEVEQTGRETTMAKINEILINALHFKTEAQLRGEKIANQMATPLLAIAGLTMLVLGPYGMIVILNSSVGNLTNIVGSVGTLSYLNIASKSGILIKDGRALESFREVDTVLFDKTGTLTEEEPVIAQIIIDTTTHYDEDSVMRFAAAAEQKLSHPIARAIVKEAQSRNLDFPAIDDSNYQLGRGITVTVSGKLVQVGSHHFMEKTNINIPSLFQEAMKRAHEKGNSLVMVAIEKNIVGAVELQASVRPEVVDIIQGLRKRGIKQIAIVSGDHREPTSNLARQLGMDSFFYDVLPEEKANIVIELQEQGKKVCFVGDGINDAIAMKKANVSVSLKGASSIATDAAQIIFMDGTLGNLCAMFDISKDLNSNLTNSLGFLLLPFGVNVLGTYVAGMSLASAIVFKQVCFLTGLGNVMLPTASIKSLREQNK